MGKKRGAIHYIIFLFLVCLLLFAACVGGPDASGPESNVLELENKGTVMGLGTPEWVSTYLSRGVSALQSLEQYRGKYVVVGEESGVNRQFVLSWADQASAQQRIGSLLRTSIASRYGAAISAGAQTGADTQALYQAEIDNVLSAIVNVSFSGAQREADWWSLRRRYDPDNKEIYADEYTAWVLYTVPRETMNSQIALAMETSVSKDSVLYDVTIALARDILLQGYDTNELQNAASIQRTAANNYDPPGTIRALAIDALDLIDDYVVGRDVAASILSRYSIFDNPALVSYANKILNALVINSPNPAAFNGYFAAVLDSDEVNAFATPGGHIFITRGLISAAKSEDALAAVIAHELAHIQLRHGMRAIEAGRDIEEWTRRFMFSGGQTIADRLNAGLSQAQEFDADIMALSLLAATGYSPQALVDMLSELEKTQGAFRGGFNSTHPSPMSRLVNARVAVARYANTANNSQLRQNRFDFVYNYFRRLL